MTVGRDAPTVKEKEVAIFCGDQKPRKIARDKTERLYQQTEGPFAHPPSQPSSPSYSIRCRWITLLAHSWLRGACLEKTMQELFGAVSTEDVHCMEAVIASDVTIPFVHAVQMMALVFNEYSIQERVDIPRVMHPWKPQVVARQAPGTRSPGILVTVWSFLRGARSHVGAERIPSLAPAVAAEATSLQQQAPNVTHKQKACNSSRGVSNHKATLIANEIKTLLLKNAIKRAPSLIMERSQRNLLYQRDFVMALLRNLGLLINLEKSNLHPKRQFTFLGFDWDTDCPSVGLTSEKENKYSCLLTDYYSALIVHDWIYSVS
ncbi:hypothetical protein CAPTEDRAFT_188264 [Capitella teleta]|uniref:Uncharacterized protein n=1 Tax=Capitella teleta TaxID=283909 RepID=R7TDQ6_CAPTE|nr:hypothetical protein CAPTEDRAFT_188264 [Capitella teleta]|eukprot:ELT91868.1 hypothetical protein CAPTEDRAFT_188264 [Capitella teleta]